MIYQAHRGVASEAPENTMSAFELAVMQGYDVIETDPSVTKDGVFVLLHDHTINRTGSNADGSPIGGEIEIKDLTYEQALKYDFGYSFHPKYKGEKLPLFTDLLALAEKSGILLKLDSKIFRFDSETLERFLTLLETTKARIAFTFSDVEQAIRISDRFKTAEINYEGVINEENLKRLKQNVHGRLVVWSPLDCAENWWCTVPFVDKKLAGFIKQYAELGVWCVHCENQLEEVEILGADVMETNGCVKPRINEGVVYDMHCHTDHSHDCGCPANDRIKNAIKNKLTGIAVTDHCDIFLYGKDDFHKRIGGSVAEAEKKRVEYSGQLDILTGIELGDGYTFPAQADIMSRAFNYDVVVGSVHSLRFKEVFSPCSDADFTVATKEELINYLHEYFGLVLDMVKTENIDILAHLTYPFRYINGKYGFDIDDSLFDGQMKSIFNEIIKRGISLEVNTANIGNKNFNVFVPEKRVLENYRKAGGYIVTLASDAHTDTGSGKAFDSALKLLSEIGFKNIYYFRRRRPVQCAII